MNAKWITPAITALDRQGRVDLNGNAAFYNFLIEGGIDGILILGSIGEFFAIPMEQKKQLILHAIDTVKKRVPLYVGTGSMLLEECIELSNFALGHGADAAVVISPYYFQLPASSQIEFYEEIARNISGPMILYNFPARTGYSLSADTVLKLAVKHDNIVGIKDTTDEMSHTRSLIQTVKNVRPEFAVYSGFDEYFMHNLLCGGDGCIAGISNFAPRLLSELVRAARSDDLESAARYQKKVDALMEIYNIGSQFVPIIKEAVSQCGVPISAKCTAPLPQVSSKQREEIRSLLKKAGLLS